MRFIRKNGRVIPIQDDHSTNKLIGGAAAGVAAGAAIHIKAPVLAKKAETKGLKFAKQAGRFYAKGDTNGYFNKRSSDFSKAAKSFSESKAPSALTMASNFSKRAAHNAKRFSQASQLAKKTGNVSMKFYKIAKILRKV